MTGLDEPAGLQRDRMTLGGRGPQGNRDRARTPMLWDASPPGGVTADGVMPWLPVERGSVRSVADQKADPSSTLALCRSLIALRHAELGGPVSDYEMLAGPDEQWAYRVGGLVVAANFSDQAVVVSCPVGEVLLSTSAMTADFGEPVPAGEPVTLEPWAGIAARHPGMLPFPPS